MSGIGTPPPEQGYPLSPQQHAAWRRGGAHDAGAVVEIRGPLDEGRLRDALAQIVRRHEMLRTRTERPDGLDVPLQFVGNVDAAAALDARVMAVGADTYHLELRTTRLHADPATLHVLVEELVAQYGGAPTIEESPLQYVDYASWARDMLEGSEGEAGRRFWSSRIAPEAVPKQPPAEAAVATASLDVAATMVQLLAAWQLTVWAEGQLAPGPVSVRFDGRHQEALRDVVGPIERWLPIEAALDREATFAAICDDLDRQLAACATHQEYYPVAHDHSPDWGFAYTRVRTATGGGVAFRVRETWPRGGPARTTLEVTADEARATLALVYDAAQVPAAEAARRLAQYQALVTAAVAAPAQPVGVWLAGPRPAGPPTVAPGPDLITAVTATARTHPTRVAVQAGATALTYAALVAQASRLAADLRAHGAGPETCVGLALDRAAPALVAWLAVLGAGAAVVPLDVEGPPARLAAQLAHARLALLLTTRRHRAALPPTTAVVLCLDADAPAADPQADAAPLAVPQSDQLAYILFTSGSTGTPKAVAVPHRALAHYAAALRQRLDAVSGAHWGFVSPLTADLGYTSLLGAWTTGGTLHLLDPSTPAAGATLDYLKITPPHLAAWLRALPAPATCLPRRALLLGGDAAPWPLLEQLTTLAPTLTLVNHYGPTETTIGVLTGPATPLPPPRPVAPPLGTPLAHVAAYILDAALDPVWPGAVGLLWIGGPSLARGYAHAPALTAAAFRPNPFATTPGARMYATGDRVRLGPDGAVEFLGRADRQLKLRGHRLEPAEIEAALARHPAVSTALVLPTRDQTQELSLSAFVVLDERTSDVGRLLRLNPADLPPGSSLFELPNGQTIVHQNRTMTQFVYHEIFDEQSYLRGGISLGEDATIIDVGGNIGLFSLFIAANWPSARIYAFEPIPSTCALLQLNAAIWAPRTVVENCGLGSATTRALFTHYPDFSGASGRFADPIRDAASMNALARSQAVSTMTTDADLAFIGDALAGRWRSERVLAQVRTLSAVIAQHGLSRIDLLKIDAESSEADILRGIDSDHWTMIEQVVLEAHGDAMRRDTEAILRERGYLVEVDRIEAYRETPVYHVYGLRPTAAPPEHRRPVTRSFGAGAAIDDIQSFLREQLPEPMRPSSIRLLASLPLTPNGKIDVAALSSLGPAAPVLSTYEEPATPLECAISSQWAELIRRPRVGATDNFFLLGGHSLMAIQSLSRLRSMLQLELPLRTIFDAPTPRSLAQAIVAGERTPGDADRAAAIWLAIEAMSPAEIQAALDHE